MWVRAQKRTTIIQIQAVYMQARAGMYCVFGRADGEDYELGSYSKPEGAMAVMDDLDSMLTSGHLTYTLPKEKPCRSLSTK